MKNALYLAMCIELVGCAVQPGSNSIGNGRYLQILSGSEVVYEMDVVAAGHRNCPNQVGMILQQNPKLSARCAHEATTQAMPFSFTAHIQTNVQDEVKPSSPFVVRLSTSARCKAAMEATRAQEKTVILENHCGLPPSDASPAKPTTSVPPAAVPPTGPGKSAAQPAPAIALPASPAAVNNTPRDEATSLQKLKELRDKGLISQDEYEKKRKEVLDRL